MLEPLQLRFHPSCYNCMSWSLDGQLAIAAGGIVCVLSPKATNVKEGTQEQIPQRLAVSQWDIIRLKTNLFTEEEVQLILPEAIATFSIGVEQSLSHAVSIAWSPPGPALYRRCMLGVLTSNLVLSLWQAVGDSSKWSRTLIVNHSLRNYFKSIIDDETMLLRKQRIRAFCWSPSLKFHGSQNDIDDYQARWGVNFLVVSNDTNDIIIMKMMDARLAKDSGYDGPVVEVISHYSLPAPKPLFPTANQSSLFAASLANREAVTDMSWGPWAHVQKGASEANSRTYQSSIALIHGSELRLIHVELESGLVENEVLLKSFTLGDEKSSLQSRLETLDIKGPLHWITVKDDANYFGLAAGMMRGFIVLTIPRRCYQRSPPDLASPEVGFYRQDFEESQTNWYPISGFTSTKNEKGDRSDLYTMTLSSYLQCLEFPSMAPPQTSLDGNGPSQETFLKKDIDSFRSRFDLDYDLNGMSIAKSWGLGTFRGWVATCATFHPTDIVQHITASQERMTVFFSPPSPHKLDHTDVGMPWHLPTLDQQDINEARQTIIRFTLKQREKIVNGDTWSWKLPYAAACSVIVERILDAELISDAIETIMLLSRGSGLDLGQEITLLNELDGNGSANRVIPSKGLDELEGIGRDVFEKCDICGAGFEWYSSTESQCANGHLFTRCSLTFLSIQDPSISKQCSLCERESLDDMSPEFDQQKALGKNGSLLTRILDRFDICVYCGGKFKA